MSQNWPYLEKFCLEPPLASMRESGASGNKVSKDRFELCQLYLKSQNTLSVIAKSKTPGLSKI